MKYLLGFFLGFMMVSCKTQNKTATNIQQIEYQATGCFGTCPIFTLTIQRDKSANFEAERFNFSQEMSKEAFSKEREGSFTTNIKSNDYQTLIKLINSVKPKTLKDYYGNDNITDLPTSYLRIKYDDGTSKIIKDYGKNGTTELKKVYQFIEELRFNQNWKKIK